MMKKWISLLLALTVLLAAFVSCKEDEVNGGFGGQPSSQQSSYVLEYANKGEVYGCDYAIGASIDTILNDYNVDANGEYKEGFEPDIERYFSMTGLDTDQVRIDTGDARYYYNSDLRDQGVAFIADYGGAYDFHVGNTDLNDVKEAVGIVPAREEMVYNHDTQTGEVPWFYRVGIASIYMVEYDLSDYVLAFYFENDKLTATTLYSKTLWR